MLQSYFSNQHSEDSTNFNMSSTKKRKANDDTAEIRGEEGIKVCNGEDKRESRAKKNISAEIRGEERIKVCNGEDKRESRAKKNISTRKRGEGRSLNKRCEAYKRKSRSTHTKQCINSAPRKHNTSANKKSIGTPGKKNVCVPVKGSCTSKRSNPEIIQTSYKPEDLESDVLSGDVLNERKTSSISINQAANYVTQMNVINFDITLNNISNIIKHVSCCSLNNDTLNPVQKLASTISTIRAFHMCNRIINGASNFPLGLDSSFEKFISDTESSSSSGNKIPLKLSTHKNLKRDCSSANINSLPEGVLHNIFTYLEQDELSKIGRVCKRWYMLTRSPLHWSQVDVTFPKDLQQKDQAVYKLIEMLPHASTITVVKLKFKYISRWENPLNFELFSLRLSEKCPNLKTLKFISIDIANGLPSVIDICSENFNNVEKLVMCYCHFAKEPRKVKEGSKSKIELLDVLGSQDVQFDNGVFFKLPHLKKLHLARTFVEDSWYKGNSSFLKNLEVLDLGATIVGSMTFQTIARYGSNLSELYMCSSHIKDNDLIIFSRNSLPHLKTFCLKCCDYITFKGIIFLIRNFDSLEDVYVNQDILDKFETLPYIIDDSNIVKSLSCFHPIVHYFL